ncbi:hypothetical protein [Pseudocitrobacter cyperus]|uniref:Type 1 fimbrial protein n=1 Tax=Pseudocitrobacter cyperus TaxID=3112843 RepID=A0ABV0HJ45_9ENTR
MTGEGVSIIGHHPSHHGLNEGKEMDKRKHHGCVSMINSRSVILMLYFLSAAVIARGVSQIHFSGAVIESGCWHEPGTVEILCQKKNTVEHHLIVENLTTTISSHNVTVEQHYLDEDKLLTVFRIIYD